jgi:hypothetical protein
MLSGILCCAHCEGFCNYSMFPAIGHVWGMVYAGYMNLLIA